MEWYNILAIVLGAFGGVGGFVALYKAKPEKTSIEVQNMKEMLDASHRMYDEMKAEKESANQDYTEYKRETMQYITEFKDRFAKVERRLDRAEDAVFQLKGAIYRGYRCQYPINIEDCPVIKEYERIQCERCEGCDDQQ